MIIVSAATGTELVTTSLAPVGANGRRIRIMFKLMVLLKRKQGMSMKDFIDYYETNHARLGERVAGGLAVKYVRRYLMPMHDMIAIEQTKEPEFDCAMEMWFESREQYDALIKRSAEPEMIKLIVDDESRFLDRTKRLFVSVEEYNSELAG
jgi:hypothetical protein